MPGICGRLFLTNARPIFPLAEALFPDMKNKTEKQPPAISAGFDPAGPIPFPLLLSLEIAPAEGGRDAEKLEGDADRCAAMAAAYLAGCPGGACLQWPVGAGWSELYLHPAETLAENLTRAWEELEGIGQAPAILPEDESAMARIIVPALLAAARDLEERGRA